MTTIPAAANVGVAAAYGDWSEVRGAATQLAVNLTCIVVAVVTTLTLQRVRPAPARQEGQQEPAASAQPRDPARQPTARSPQIASKSTAWRFRATYARIGSVPNQSRLRTEL